jgi:ADP-dependent phosphofructokinase/glucokinase
VPAASEEFKATFAAARGERGAILRANAEKMALALREAREGEASKEFRKLINF